MNHLAYTGGGVLSDAIMALREKGLRVQVRSLRNFGSVESTVRGVFIDVEDSRIRDAYESKGISVTLLSGAEQENTSKPKGTLKLERAHGTVSRERNRSS